MLDAIVLTFSDFANTGYRFSKCLKLLGLEVQLFKGKAHKFLYPEQAQISELITEGKRTSKYPPTYIVPGFRSRVEQAHVVHFIASTFIDTGADLSNKFVVAQHGGTVYRTEPKRCNAVFDPIVHTSIIQCPDLLGLGAKNEVLVYYPVDTNFFQPDFKLKSNKLLIGHFPSKTSAKGTSTIVGIIRELEKDPILNRKFEYIGLTEMGRIPWLENIKRLKGCDIIIETCNPVLKEKRFGEWGNTALEAAALGKIVVTNMLSEGIYRREYGECSLLVANNPEQLRERLVELLNMSDSELLEKKQKTREWVVKNHSLEPTAKRLWNKVYCNFFKGDKRAEIQDKVNNMKVGEDKK